MLKLYSVLATTLNFRSTKNKKNEKDNPMTISMYLFEQM